MANQRALVIVDGVQQRIPYDQANGADKLDIGSGIVGFAKGDSTDSTPLAFIELAHADQRLDVLGNAHFKKDIKIEGELTVVGTASVADTFVEQTIFNQSVQFGDAYAGDTAVFRSAIEALNRGVDLRVLGAAVDNKFSVSSLGAEVIANEAALPAGGDEGVLYFSEAEQKYWLSDPSTGVWAEATAQELTDLLDFMELRGAGGGQFQLKANGVDIDGHSVTIDAGASLSLDGKENTNLSMISDSSDLKTLTIRAQNDGIGAAMLDMSADGKVEIDGGDTSHFKTSAGDLDLEGQVNLQARAETGFLEALAGPAAAPATMMNGNGVGAGDVAIAASSDVGVHAGASIDMDATTDVLANAGGKADIVAVDSSKFQVTADSKLLSLQADGSQSVVLLSAPNAAGGSVVGSATSLVKMTAGDPAALNLDDIKGELRISKFDASHLWSYQDFDLKLESRGTGNLLADSGDKMILRAGDHSQQSNLEALLTGKELAMSAEGKAYLWSDQGIDALAPAINEGTSDGNFVMTASTQAVTAAAIDTPSTLGQMHLASAARMQLDSQAGIQLDADDASHFKTSSGSLTLESTAAHVLTKAATFFSSMSTVDGLNKPSIVFGGPSASFAASGVGDPSGAMVVLGEDFASLLKSQDEQDLEVKSKKRDITIYAGEDAFTDTANKTGAGGDIIISAKGYIDEGTAPLEQRGGNIVIQALGQYNDLAGSVLSTDAAAEGFLTLDAANELRLHPGHDGTDSKHVIVMKSDGSSPNLDAPADAVARIRNVMDPEKDQDVVTKKYMEENGGGTAKLTIAAAEVATMAVGDLVSLNSSGEIIQASGKSTEEANGRFYAIGFVTKIENSNQALVRMLGKYELPAAHNITAGQPVYMAADVFNAGSAGNIVATAPSDEGDMVQRVGFSLGGSLILVAIGEPVLL